MAVLPVFKRYKKQQETKNMFQYKTASRLTYDYITLDVRRLVKRYFPTEDVMTFVIFPKILQCVLHVNTSEFGLIIMLDDNTCQTGTIEEVGRQNVIRFDIGIMHALEAFLQSKVHDT